MTKRLIIILFLVASIYMDSTLFARELREYALEEKIKRSDLIFVGSVLAIERPEQSIHGVKVFAVVNVVELIKGIHLGDKLKFVVEGSVPESNPACCLVGGDYLFFAINGVQTLVLEESGIGGRITLQGDFVSPSNGKFSTYSVVSGVVLGWPNKEVGEERSLNSVREKIHETE